MAKVQFQVGDKVRYKSAWLANNGGETVSELCEMRGKVTNTDNQNVKPIPRINVLWDGETEEKSAGIQALEKCK